MILYPATWNERVFKVMETLNPTRHGRSGEAFENAPQNSANEGSDWFDTRRPGWEALAFPSFDTEPLAGKTR